MHLIITGTPLGTKHRTVGTMKKQEEEEEKEKEKEEGERGKPCHRVMAQAALSLQKCIFKPVERAFFLYRFRHRSENDVNS